MAKLQDAVLGGGCFWCLDAVYRELKGVVAAVSGYAGGHVERPSYEQVCAKTTGHIEVVRVTFDAEVIGYADILRVFFAIHDPTTRDRQGADAGPQYRSAIFAADAEQAATARAVIAEIEQAGIFDARIVTEIYPPAPFWEAEPEHQDYFARNPWSGYCQGVVKPKVAKFRKQFSAWFQPRAAAA